jgi:asparagine synthase (glutamine-hydrolysing)
MDQPSVDGINTYFVARETAATGLKVALSGVGGDELFGTYPSFQQIPQAVARLAPFAHVPLLPQLFRRVSAPVLARLTSPKYAGVFEYGGDHGGTYLLRRGLFMPWELPELMDADMAGEGWRELATLARLEDRHRDIRHGWLKVMALEMGCYMRDQLLRDADWAGMAHGLEIRTPLVDVALFRSLLPALVSERRPSKRDMALTSKPALPAAVLDRPKTGFVVPVRDWLMAGGQAGSARGLRGWARLVHSRFAGASP